MSQTRQVELKNHTERYLGQFNDRVAQVCNPHERTVSIFDGGWNCGKVSSERTLRGKITVLRRSIGVKKKEGRRG